MPEISVFRLRWRTLLAVLGAVLLPGGCDLTGPDEVALVEVVAPSPDVLVRDSVTLTATLRTTSGKPVSGRPVSWKSSDTTVATVGASGVVYGVKPGSVVVTAASEGMSGQTSLTVRQRPVASVTVSPDGYTVGTGRTMQLTVAAVTALGDTLRDAAVSWSSSDTTRVKMLGDGKVQGVSEGSAVVTATVGGKSANATVVVGKPLTNIHFFDFSVPLGSAVEVKPGLSDPNGKRQLLWSSSEERVATVDPSGVVRGLASGKAIITATSEGLTARATAFVIGPAVSVVLTPDSLALPPGGEVLVIATAKDAGGNPARHSTFTWSSSNPAVAKASGGNVHEGTARGGITPVTPGTALVVVTADGVSDTAQVTVLVPTATVEVLPDTATLAVGASRQFRAVARDAQGSVLTGRPVSWSSTNLGVANVDGSGQATARAPGTTHIVATVEGRIGSARVTVPGSVSTSGNWASVAAGNGHTCALDRSGAAWCWGRNDQGQLGNGTTAASSIPVAVSGGRLFTQMSAGGTVTCGITRTGELFCWGMYGTYGSGPLVRDVRFRFVDVDKHVCGITVSGDGYCWFPPDYGRLSTPMVQPGPFTAFAAYHPCGILGTTGETVCWDASSQQWVTRPPAPSRRVGITDSGLFRCEWRENGEAHCTNSTAIQSGGRSSVFGSQLVPGGHRFVQVSAGSSQACGVTDAGEVFCWSMTFKSSSGITYPVEMGTPIRLGGGVRFSQISAGHDHACGVTPGGALLCWGGNEHGQLGTGSTGGASAEPARVRNP